MDDKKIDLDLSDVFEKGELTRKKPPEPPERKSVGFRISLDLLDHVRAASFWSKESIVQIMERALSRELKKMEKTRGKPFARPGTEPEEGT